MSKLACGLHKPNQQTMLPMGSVAELWSTMPISKVRNLGGKLGDSLASKFSIQTMGELAGLSMNQLRAHFEEKTV